MAKLTPRMTASIWEIVFPVFYYFGTAENSVCHGVSLAAIYNVLLLLTISPPKIIVTIATYIKIALWESKYPTIKVFTIRECAMVPGCCPEPYDLVFGAGADFARLARRYWNWNDCGPPKEDKRTNQSSMPFASIASVEVSSVDKSEAANILVIFNDGIVYISPV